MKIYPERDYFFPKRDTLSVLAYVHLLYRSASPWDGMMMCEAMFDFLPAITKSLLDYCLTTYLPCPGMSACLSSGMSHGGISSSLQ